MDIKQEILNYAQSKTTFKTTDIVSMLEGRVSRQYIVRLIKELVADKKLIKRGATRQATYALPVNAAALGVILTRRLANKNLREHEIFDHTVQEFPPLNTLQENVLSILNYAFSEMLNNAIEHSKSKNIEVSFEESDGSIIFVVNDFGIGVYRNVMKKHGLRSELEAIQDLLKGKTTTDPQAHSGEGIFFTSKVADVFSLESYGYRLRVDNRLPDTFIENTRTEKRGTKVVFQLAINSPKHLNDVFKDYQSDPQSYAFDKTKIQIKLYTMGTIYISRSQARRILSGLEKFQTIVLDFNRVPTVGQAFADEVFRVFQQRYPHIEILPVHMNEAVEFMVRRVEKPLK